jgi:glutamine synthetase
MDDLSRVWTKHSTRLRAANVRNAEDASRLVEERKLTHVQVGITDLEGVLRGKLLAARDFDTGLENRLQFSDLILGWDLDDRVFENSEFTGWNKGFPDASVRVLPTSCRELLIDEDQVLFLCEFAGAAEKLCPRAALRQQVERAREMGFEPWGSVEYEFFLFDETSQSAAAKDFTNLNPIDPSNFGYSVLRLASQNAFFRNVLQGFDYMRTPVESFHAASGPGAFEAALAYEKLLEAGDRAALFKTFMKIFAQQDGKTASFMAKLAEDLPGQGGHVHISLRKRQDDSACFFESDAAFQMSETMRQFVAGCQRYMHDVFAFLAPNVNSYARFSPHTLAPVNTSWGVENRTCALRVITGTPESQRLEYRVPGADANPYLSLAAVLAAGLRGIEEKLELEPPVTGDAYGASGEGALPLPMSLGSAATLMANSEMAQSAFGKEMVQHFTATRIQEDLRYRRAVTDWERRRYFEIV